MGPFSLKSFFDSTNGVLVNTGLSSVPTPASKMVLVLYGISEELDIAST